MLNVRRRIREVLQSEPEPKLPTGCGVYAIIHTATSRAYIGSAKNIRSRAVYHRSALRNGFHSNQRLAADWTLYGEDAFRFAVLTLCEEAERMSVESALVDQVIGPECYNWSGPGQKCSQVVYEAACRHPANLQRRVRAAFDEWAATSLPTASATDLATAWMAWHDGAFYERDRIRAMYQEDDSAYLDEDESFDEYKAFYQ